MRQKRILKRIIIALCCVITLLPSNMVFATAVEDAEADGLYDRFAKIFMWTQAAEYCAHKIMGRGDAHSTNLHENKEEQREKILKLINLDFEYSMYTKRYSSFLESESENTGNEFGGGKGDGIVWCSELNGLIFSTLLKFFKNDAANLKQTAMCGVKDSVEPLFKIELKYGGDGDWPRGWTAPSGSDYLTTDECNENYGNIVSILETGGVITEGDLKLTLRINDEFSAGKWLKDYVGIAELSDLSEMMTVYRRANRAMRYMTFEKICRPNTITEEEYNGPGGTNVYRIFDLIGEMKYVKLDADMVNKEVYPNLDIASSDGETTCNDLAKSFDDSEWVANARYYQIMGCYNQHSQNVEEFRKIKTYLSHILTTANSLVANAKSIKDKQYTGSEGPYGAKRIIEGYIRDSGIENSTVLRDLVNETETLEVARDNFYEWKWRSGTHSGREESEVIPAYNRAIEHYESYIEAFKADIVDTISDKVGAVPDLEYAWNNININSLSNDVTGFYHFSDTSFTCIATQDDLRVMDEINSILGGTIDISDYTPPTIDIDDGSGPEGETDPCYAGSGPLGWILCPVITAASGIGEFMWDQIESVLFVPVGEIFKDDNGVENAWKVIRDIANVIFIILFLAVIFSQLTGVGIDNYGIKKILPKLIVVAILVNLSYVICKVAIDISNIVGSGIDSMLSGFADSVVTVSGASTGWQIGSWLTTIAGVGAGVTIWVLLSEGGLREVGAVIGLAALGIVISILAAVTFMYIILGVRMAGVILCTVLSPVAIVCYALPNTEKIYKKWFDLFKALLVVYPICGAMIGMGQFAGAILASIPNGTMKLMAMIVQVVPFFFVPTLLKNSLSLMGNVGAKLSSMGKTFGRKGSGFAKNTIKGTDAYKGFSQRSLERKAERTVNRLGRRTNLNRRQQARMAAANSVLDERAKRQRENEQKSDLSYRGAMDAKIGLESEESRRNLSDYNNTDFVHAKRTQDRVSHDESVQDALLYNNGDYVSGKLVQKRLSRENDLQGSVLYTRAGFEDSRRQQYEANRRSEVKKMYSERYNNTSAAHRQSELSGALRGNAADPTEQMDAAFDSLMATGDVTEVLNALNGIGGGDLDAMDQGLRDRVLAKAAASGNQLLKGWAKANAGNNPKVGLRDYINNINNDFSQYLNTQAGEHVFDNADKDTLRFLASHGGGAALSGQILSNILTTSANTSGVAKQAALDLIRGREAEIGNLISAEGLTKISPEIAGQLGRINLTNAINDIGRSGNEQLRAKVNPEVARILGI